jgi:hypothetical protein
MIPENRFEDYGVNWISMPSLVSLSIEDKCIRVGKRCIPAPIDRQRNIRGVG